MQDFETDSYWSIMTHEAIEGEEKGTKLKELPIAVKVHWEEWVKKYAVVNESIEGGRVFDLGSARIFLYRPEGAEMFYSTVAYLTKSLGFAKVENGWKEIDSDCVFTPETESFTKGKTTCPKRFNGFDTFWYTWSLNNPETELLGADH